jgi:hypothetical protein
LDGGTFDTIYKQTNSYFSMNIKNFVLGIGILVVYALVLWQGIQAFYPAPEWDDFCNVGPREPRAIGLQGVEDCSFNQGLLDKELACSEVGGMFRFEYDNVGCPMSGYCDECSLDYDDARDDYSRNIFIISLVISVLTLVVGFFVLKVEPVGSALLASGIWAIFYGTVWNWRNFGAGIRFGLLLLLLIALIWIALRLNRRRNRR